ncbi:hypothetical protein HMPREF3193_01004 [Bifidobacterium breve]|nr:hypothetical protein HMPREF3193_01004 [Bifidobacterium breve]
MRTSTKQAMIRGFKAEVTAELTGRTRKSEAPKIMTSLELQTKAWNLTGYSIRKAMDRR